MFILFSSLSSFESDLVTTEISTFYGIRYNRNGFAVLSTEHSNHDYLLPMDVRHYQAFMAELEEAVRKSPGGIKITGDKVYRVRRGAMLHLEDKRGSVYHIEIL